MNDKAQTRPSLLAANLLCMASMFIWAAGLPAAQPLIHKLPPLSLTAARMALAALSMLPCWALMDGWGALRAAQWGKGLLIGASTIGLGAFMLVTGQGMSDPVTVAIISASMPVVGIAIELLLDGRKLT
ncbi:MAG: DMT family transporter, partial [Rhodobacteraceae bacterium]|nr:DMT family transporter [Paracoccaceae bacterium]